MDASMKSLLPRPTLPGQNVLEVSPFACLMTKDQIMSALTMDRIMILQWSKS